MLNTISLLDALIFCKSLPDDYVDLVVSSPPYNIGKEYESKKSLDLYIKEQNALLKECVRVLKPTGSIMWQLGSYCHNGMTIPLDVKIFPILESFGMLPINRIVWIRPHGLHSKNKFSGRHETILWFSKSKNYTFNLDSIRVPQKYQNKKYHKGQKQGQFSCNPLGKNCGDIWAFQNVKHNHEEQTIHPCQFPEDMIARIILATTNKGEIVLDPYMGSGTTAVVAHNLNRNFIGSEIDKKYHSIAMSRLNGNPDGKNFFPNLKTLRQYVDSNKVNIEDFKFDVQVGNIPTTKNKSKINSEDYHCVEIEKRLIEEESFFSKKLNSKE